MTELTIAVVAAADLAAWAPCTIALHIASPFKGQFPTLYDLLDADDVEIGDRYITIQANGRGNPTPLPVRLTPTRAVELLAWHNPLEEAP